MDHPSEIARLYPWSPTKVKIASAPGPPFQLQARNPVRCIDYL